MSIDKACIVHISSDWGSIYEREISECGSLYPYRCSKIALNMAMKNLSIDLKEDEILVTSIHPGWVKTDMGGAKADISVEEAASGLIDRFSELSIKKTGCFETWDGKKHPL